MFIPTQTTLHNYLETPLKCRSVTNCATSKFKFSKYKWLHRSLENISWSLDQSAVSVAWFR